MRRVFFMMAVLILVLVDVRVVGRSQTPAKSTASEVKTRKTRSTAGASGIETLLRTLTITESSPDDGKSDDGKSGDGKSGDRVGRTGLIPPKVQLTAVDAAYASEMLQKSFADNLNGPIIEPVSLSPNSLSYLWKKPPIRTSATP